MGSFVFSVLVVCIFAVWAVGFYLLNEHTDLFKKKTKETTVSSETKDKSVSRAFDYEIDDLSYIADIKHLSNGP